MWAAIVFSLGHTNDVLLHEYSGSFFSQSDLLVGVAYIPIMVSVHSHECP